MNRSPVLLATMRAAAFATLVAASFVAFALSPSFATEPPPGTPPGGSALTPQTRHLADGATSPAATIDQVAWIAGAWTCEALGGTAEEFWQPAAGGEMLGSFRMLREGKPSFYELATIAEKDGSLVCRILHFDPNLIHWEKEGGVPQTFPLVKIDATTAWFDGLTFERNDDGSMDVWVEIHRKDGTTKETLFAYRPIRATNPKEKKS